MSTLSWSFGTHHPQLLIFICPPTYLACKRSRREVLSEPPSSLPGVGSILPDEDAAFFFHCFFSWRCLGPVMEVAFVTQGRDTLLASGSLLSTRWLSEKNHSLLKVISHCLKCEGCHQFRASCLGILMQWCGFIKDIILPLLWGSKWIYRIHDTCLPCLMSKKLRRDHHNLLCLVF